MSTSPLLCQNHCDTNVGVIARNPCTHRKGAYDIMNVFTQKAQVKVLLKHRTIMYTFKFI